MDNSFSVPKLIIAGVIANELRTPPHHAQRVLATRSDIRPSARTGNLRLYDGRVLIGQELNAIDALRCPKAVPP